MSCQKKPSQLIREGAAISKPLSAELYREEADGCRSACAVGAGYLALHGPEHAKTSTLGTYEQAREIGLSGHWLEHERRLLLNSLFISLSVIPYVPSTRDTFPSFVNDTYGGLVADIRLVIADALEYVGY